MEKLLQQFDAEGIHSREKSTRIHLKKRRRKDENKRFLKRGLKQNLIFWFVQMNTEKIK